MRGVGGGFRCKGRWQAVVDFELKLDESKADVINVARFGVERRWRGRCVCTLPDVVVDTIYVCTSTPHGVGEIVDQVLSGRVNRTHPIVWVSNWVPNAKLVLGTQPQNKFKILPQQQSFLSIDFKLLNLYKAITI